MDVKPVSTLHGCVKKRGFYKFQNGYFKKTWEAKNKIADGSTVKNVEVKWI